MKKSALTYTAGIMRYPTFRIFTFLLSILFCQAEAYPFTLVIDPGHGGKDIGAVGKITNEKTINLNVAKKIEKIMKKELPDVKTVFTRQKDVFISLQERARIANKAGGDLFISIHVNSIDRRNRKRATIQGASVYTLGLHKSADNLEVAKRENSVMVLESDYEERYEGFNPESAESYIIFELSQNMHFEQSVRLADDIQHELTTVAGRADKGVRQAGFWVLWATSMPSVLVELDFICNPVQEKFLASDEGQELMAQSIFNAVSRFISSGGSVHAPSKTAVSSDSGIREIGNADKGMYTIVFLTTTSNLRAGDPSLKGIENVCHSKNGPLHRYSTVPVPSEQDAKKDFNKIKRIFPSAFIKKLE